MNSFVFLWMLTAQLASDDKLPIDEVKGAEETVATFSIVARDPATGELGLAVQSRAFRAGRTVPYGKPGVGMIASQAGAARTPYGRKGMAMLEEGLSPDEIIKRLTEPDEGRGVRQVAVIDNEGRVKAYTGADCGHWAGHIEGENYSVQGNILAGEEVVKAMARTFESSKGELAERLMAVLEAGQAAGGDAPRHAGGRHLGHGTLRPVPRERRIRSPPRGGHPGRRQPGPVQGATPAVEHHAGRAPLPNVSTPGRGRQVHRSHRGAEKSAHLQPGRQRDLRPRAALRSGW